MSQSQTPSSIRRQLRQNRRAISPAQRRRWDADICGALWRSPELRRAAHVASYWAHDGEVDLHALHLRLLVYRTQLLLPVLKPGTRLGFAPFDINEPLVTNRFGIPEPQTRKRLSPRLLSLVLVPLVGFDDAGHRLGMGAGYYDRSLAFMRHATAGKRPQLIGVGYELQRCQSMPVQPWDVPLDGVVTEAGLRMGLRDDSAASE